MSQQRNRLDALFAGDAHVEVEATWSIHQSMIAPYRDPDPTRGRDKMRQLIDGVNQGFPVSVRASASPGAHPGAFRGFFAGAILTTLRPIA